MVVGIMTLSAQLNERDNLVYLFLLLTKSVKYAKITVLIEVNGYEI